MQNFPGFPFQRYSVQSPTHAQAGLSLPELISVIAIIGVVCTVTAPGMKTGKNALNDSSNRLSSIMKLARTQAMAQTSAYRISPQSDTHVLVERGATCGSANWEAVSTFNDDSVTLDEGISFAAASQNGVNANPTNGWNVCFDSRGMSNKTLEVSLMDSSNNQTRTLKVFRGGGVDL